MVLNTYTWPGNVRELFQAVECSLADAHESMVLEPVHLPLSIRLSVTRKNLEKRKELAVVLDEPLLSDGLSCMPTIKADRERAIQAEEKQYLRTLLRLSGGDIKQCCKTAGLSRSRLYDVLKKYGLSQNTTTLHR